MTELQKWQEVNQCESETELGYLMLKLADEDLKIQGRSKKFDVTEMIIGLEMFMKNQMHANILTREFGIRQQAIYLKSLNR